MKINRTTSTNFGLKITDNVPLQMAKHFLTSRASTQETLEAFRLIRNCVNDSYEFTLKEFTLGKPCEAWIKKSFSAPETIQIKFASIKEKEVKRGRKPKNPPSLIYDTLSVSKFAEIISNAAKRYSNLISK